MGRDIICFPTLGGEHGGGQSLLVGPPEDAPPTDLGRGRLAGALARRQRSALVALACPDLPPSALSDSGLHLQAQQRARCALGRHGRACVSGYRPHLRAAATARAVMAVHAGLATDEAAAAKERQEAELLQSEHDQWGRLLTAAYTYTKCCDTYAVSTEHHTPDVLRAVGRALSALVGAIAFLDSRAVATSLRTNWQTAAAAAAVEERQHMSACGPVTVGAGLHLCRALEAGHS